MQILRKPDIRRLTGLSPRTIDGLEKAGRFPRRFPISARAVGWDSRAVQTWLEERSAGREAVQS